MFLSKKCKYINYKSLCNYRIVLPLRCGDTLEFLGLETWVVGVGIWGVVCVGTGPWPCCEGEFRLWFRYTGDILFAFVPIANEVVKSKIKWLSKWNYF